MAFGGTFDFISTTTIVYSNTTGSSSSHTPSQNDIILVFCFHSTSTPDTSSIVAPNWTITFSEHASSPWTLTDGYKMELFVGRVTASSPAADTIDYTRTGAGASPVSRYMAINIGGAKTDGTPLSVIEQLKQAESYENDGENQFATFDNSLQADSATMVLCGANATNGTWAVPSTDTGYTSIRTTASEPLGATYNASGDTTPSSRTTDKFEYNYCGLLGLEIRNAGGGGGGISIPVVINHLRNQGIG